MLGAIGIARAFIASGEKDLNLVDAITEYKKKRLALLEIINLDETKKIADKKYQFTKLFFDTIDEELTFTNK